MVRTFRCIGSVISQVGFAAILVGLSCYREVTMPTIVEPTEDIRAVKLREEAAEEGQDVQSLRRLPEDQAEDRSESMKNAASNSPRGIGLVRR